MQAREQWEYISTFLEANADKKPIKTYIQETFDKKAKRHSPESMIPDLNRLGAEGWELVHMEPVPRVGRKEDIQFDEWNWTNTYFCVFKRRIANEMMSAQVAPIAAQAADDNEYDLDDIPAPQLDPNMMAF